jgi:AraC family transcriptional regulator
MHEQPANHIEKDHHNRVRKVLAYIQENLSVDISLAKMAEVANFSPYHFQKLFTQYVGESPKQYVLRLRLERIAHNLKLFPEQSVFELSLQSGFSSPSTFGRAFKNYYGITPDEFRRLSHTEISKICTSKSNKSKDYDNLSHEFWNVNFDEEVSVDFTSGSKIEVIKLSSLKVAFIDSHLGSHNAVSNTFKALYNLAAPRDLINNETRFIGVFLDLPFFTELSKCRFRACITLPANVTIPKEIVVGEIPENKYATYSIKGSTIDTLKSLVAFKHHWLDNSGYQIAETTGYEEYPLNPATEEYENIKREVYIPVKPA